MQIYENETTEFKEEWTESAKKTICAFANSYGGTIYFGVRDDGVAIGIPDNKVDRLIRIVTDVASYGVVPSADHLVRCLKSQSEGKTILEVRVSAGPDMPYAVKIKDEGTRVFVRRGAACYEATDEELRQLYRNSNPVALEQRVSRLQELSFRETEAFFAKHPQNVYLANRTASKAEKLAGELGCNTTTNAEVAARCDLIFLGVKPQMMESLLAPLKFSLNERPGRFILCSMAAGLSITRIQEMAGEDYPVIRIMPNTPATVGDGMIQYCSSNVTAEEEAEFLEADGPGRPAGCRAGIPHRRGQLRVRLRPGLGVPVSLRHWPTAAWPAACLGPRRRSTPPRWCWAAPRWCWKAASTPVPSRTPCAAPAAAPSRASGCWKKRACGALSSTPCWPLTIRPKRWERVNALCAS